MRESVIEKAFVKRVEELGGEIRKLKWIGRNSAPDRFVMLPMRPRTTPLGTSGTFTTGVSSPTCFLVEFKAPGKAPTIRQAREHERLRRVGMRVEVVDSLERVEEVLR